MKTKLKPHELDVPAHDLRRFDWDRENNVLTAEASSLNGFSIRRLYNDALDHGIAIHSPSGTTKRFVLTGTDEDGEDEVQGWHFRPVDGTGPSVLIIND